MKLRIHLRWLALFTILLAFTRAQAQPTIVSTVPANGATGVSDTAAVVFTFSEAMDTANSSVIFYNESPFALETLNQTWSDGNTVLTCSPAPTLPAGSTILWVVEGQDTLGNPVGGVPEGTFSTASAGGGTGNGSTNQYTAFGVGTVVGYNQFSAGTPTQDTNSPPYIFSADTTLSSNQTALSITLELPDAGVSNLLNNPFVPAQFYLSEGYTNQSDLSAVFGNGNYIFTVIAASSNEQVTVNLSSGIAQPAAPQISNYTQAQAIDPTQPFTLKWNAFAGGSSSDTIFFSIPEVFQSASPGTAGGLNGTATSIVIPANTLAADTSYSAYVSFYHITVTTNRAARYTTAAYRASTTTFHLVTTSGGTTLPTGPINLTNVSSSGNTISFYVTSDVGQSLTVQYNTSSTIDSNQWHTLLATTNTTGSVLVNDSAHTSGKQVFYRAITGQ
jgi:methionine-rich copper-binding protein CopC